MITDALELDEAEQTVLAQWFLPGYLAQPPLYTWLQIIFFKVLGVNVFALSLLKNLLLFFSYSFVFLSTRELCGNARLSVMAAISLIFIPQIAWECQRDLAHSVLVLTLSTATIYAAIRVTGKPVWRNYIFFGVLLGLGVLSKYNYFLFAGALFLSLLSTGNGRKAILDWPMVISLVLMIVIAAPYLSWFVSSFDVATASTYKLKVSTETGVLKGLGDLILAVILFLTPLWLVYLVLFRSSFLPRNRLPATEGSVLLNRYFLFLCLILLVMVVLFHVTSFKERWMIPLLFVVPAHFFINTKKEIMRGRVWRRFTGFAMTAAIVILCMITLRVVGASSLHKVTGHNFPSSAVADNIRGLGAEDALIVTDRVALAGNLRIQFPDSLVLSPDLDSLGLSFDTDGRTLIIIWDANKSGSLPGQMETYLKRNLGVEIEGMRTIYHDVPYKYNKMQYARIGVMVP